MTNLSASKVTKAPAKQATTPPKHAKQTATPAKDAKPVVKVPTGLPSNIVHYCKDCREIVEVNRVKRMYVYTCLKCGTKNVAFGTIQSIASFFHLKEIQKELKEKKRLEESGETPKVSLDTPKETTEPTTEEVK